MGEFYGLDLGQCRHCARNLAGAQINAENLYEFGVASAEVGSYDPPETCDALKRCYDAGYQAGRIKECAKAMDV